MSSDANVVEQLRQVSRLMVRELGFMGGDFAGTQLSPSAVHALIEIEPGDITARELGLRLRLEKSSISRMLRKLVDSGDVQQSSADDDARVKRLSLTPAGQARVTAIHAYARRQVVEALGRLAPGQDRQVLQGMRLYTEALGAGSRHCAAIEVVCGYRTGLIARITAMHASYYARQSGFGRHFESVVASGLAEFCNRLECPDNAVWTAIREGEIVGAIAIDGEHLGNDRAHLRWFILDDSARGSGVGKILLDTAMAFVDQRGVAHTELWTFSGLDAARHLYQSRGFVLAEERPGAQWGTRVLEQRFVRVRA